MPVRGDGVQTQECSGKASAPAGIVVT